MQGAQIKRKLQLGAFIITLGLVVACGHEACSGATPLFAPASQCAASAQATQMAGCSTTCTNGILPITGANGSPACADGTPPTISCNGSTMSGQTSVSSGTCANGGAPNANGLCPLS